MTMDEDGFFAGFIIAAILIAIVLCSVPIGEINMCEGYCQGIGFNDSEYGNHTCYCGNETVGNKLNYECVFEYEDGSWVQTWPEE